jgi:hypothetical protein
MIALVLTLVLAQPSDPSVRDRVDGGLTVLDGGYGAPCLYWPENTTIAWRQNQSGNPDTPGDTEFPAIEAAFGTWSAQLASCASLAFSQGPRTSTRTVARDGENVLLFRLTKCSAVVAANDPCWAAQTCGNAHDCWEHTVDALAITTTSYLRESGKIEDSDVEFNSDRFLFTAVDSPACVAPNFNVGCVASDIQNTATHEIGHMLGLAHTSAPSSTMNPGADPGELSKRTLDNGTRSFVCDAYPRGQAAVQCAASPSSVSPKACGCGATPGPWLLGALAAALAQRRPRSGAGSPR